MTGTVTAGDGGPGPDRGEPRCRCWVYRSSRRGEMYLYLRERDGFDLLPDGLRRLFGRPELVMELDLDPGRRLARVDARQVIASLRSSGYFLQMPPIEDPHAH